MNMKKVIFALIVAFVFTSTLSSNAKAGTPPWAQANGYNKKTTHIYLPEQNIYFDLNKNVYLFEENGVWIDSQTLPQKYSGIDFSKSRQMELTVKNEEPYKKIIEHRETYNREINATNNAYLQEQKQKLEMAENEQKAKQKELNQQIKENSQQAKAEAKQAKAEAKQAKAEAKKAKEIEKAAKKRLADEKKALANQKKLEKANAKAEATKKKAEKQAATYQKKIDKAQKQAAKAQKQADKIAKKQNK